MENVSGVKMFCGKVMRIERQEQKYRMSCWLIVSVSGPPDETFSLVPNPPCSGTYTIHMFWYNRGQQLENVSRHHSQAPTQINDGNTGTSLSRIRKPPQDEIKAVGSLPDPMSCPPRTWWRCKR